MAPVIHPSCYIAPTARIIGNVTIEEGASVWEYAVLRGDTNSIRVGKGSNVQDHVTVHTDHDAPVDIGENVSIGHMAMVHGAKIGDNCIIGIHSTILNRTVIGSGSIIGGNALVKEGSAIPGGSLVVGIPAKVVREADASLAEAARHNAEEYHRLRDEYLAGRHRAHTAPARAK